MRKKWNKALRMKGLRRNDDAMNYYSWYQKNKYL